MMHNPTEDFLEDKLQLDSHAQSRKRKGNFNKTEHIKKAQHLEIFNKTEIDSEFLENHLPINRNGKERNTEDLS